MDEKELSQLLQRGDHNAFRQLVLANEDKIINTCFRFLRNREDAEDMAQEVFIEAYQSASRFRGEAKISTWLYRIAVSKSLDYLRYARRKKRFAILKSIWQMEEQGIDLPEPSASNPHSELEKKERQILLNKAMDSIPENQKIAITLSKYEGISNKEIADIMDTSLGAVESLIHRAKKNLENKLSTYFEKNEKRAQV